MSVAPRLTLKSVFVTFRDRNRQPFFSTTVEALTSDMAVYLAEKRIPPGSPTDGFVNVKIINKEEERWTVI